MHRWIIALVLAFAVSGVILLSMLTERAVATPAQAHRTPVLVELFTSEGCSSCPPADDFLIRLDKEQPVPGAEIIAISEHVDYWNRLGWADPFSSAAFSDRQHQYARALGTNQMYTPQMVVDGRTEFIGSQEGKARREIAQAVQAPKAKVGLVKGSAHPHDDLISVQVSVGQLPRITLNDTGEVWLAITEGELSTDVRRGENAFRTLQHTGVVRRMELLRALEAGHAEGFTAEFTVSLAPEWKRQNLRAVVFIQERVSRRVLGVGQMRLGD